MKKVLEFLQDNKGQFSNARLANLLIVLSFVADWITHIVRGGAFDPSVTIVGLVCTIMGIKAAQRVVEK